MGRLLMITRGKSVVIEQNPKGMVASPPPYRVELQRARGKIYKRPLRVDIVYHDRYHCHCYFKGELQIIQKQSGRLPD